ncbi:hypothetical protein BDV97DRAFT_367413 [Delphinella strobiligena]|nr:hypothetical protein BDV97DRAFT_367413 [Delphinella strobiligena]
MGIKETGDYLTARAANPRTGLISPSVVTVQTPRTPMTPGEALRLYSHEKPQQSPTPVRPRPLLKQSQQKRRWKQHDKGCSMQTVVEVASPKMTSTSSSPSMSSEDRFVLPMPSAGEPQPYLSSAYAAARTATSTATVDYHKEKSRPLSRTSKASSAPGLKGRMLSLGAGPRKFVEASKRLRDYTLGETVENTATKSNSSPRPEANKGFQSSSPPVVEKSFVPFQMPRSTSVSSIDIITTTMNDMPGAFSPPPEHSPRISRKPIGSSTAPRKKRRDSDVTIATAISAEEKKVHVYTAYSPAVGTIFRDANESTNKDRFQDLRQLPRVKLIHPENAAASQIRDEGRLDVVPVSLPEIRTHSPPQTDLTSHHCSNASTVTPAKDNAQSVLETRLIGVLTYILSLPFQRTQSAISSPVSACLSNSQDTASSTGILHVLNTLTDEKADLSSRLEAAKQLILATGRLMLVLGLMVAVIRLSIALAQVLEVLLWPINVLIKVLRWVLGAGG